MVAHLEFGVEHVRGVRGVRGLPGSLTRCFGVMGAKASLNLTAEGVLNSIGGAFSSAHRLAKQNY
jgi:hypothetical protein